MYRTTRPYFFSVKEIAECRDSVRFRHVGEDLLTPSVVDDIVWSLYDDSDVMFDYDSMDEFISKRLKKFDIDPDDYKEDEDE